MQNKNTKTSARRRRAVVGAGLVATSTAAALTMGLAAPAHADVERHGRYGAGHYEFSVDREGRGFELSFDLDNVAVGSAWVVALRHDGKLVTRKTLRAHNDDGKGELSLERWVRNTAGSDTFKVRFRLAGTKVYKSATIKVR